MVSLDTTAVREDGITLVTLVLDDATVPVRVRVDNCLDGPVWPPRRHGVPAEGWDDDGVTATLSPGRRRALGYATPAQPAEPPAELCDVDPIEDHERGGTSADDVVRSLGDPTPPRDVVTTPMTGSDASQSEEMSSAAPPFAATPTSGERCRPPATEPSARRQTSGGPDGWVETASGADLSPVLAAWLDAVEEQIDAASVRDDGAPSPDIVDEEQLRHLAERSRALAERARRVHGGRRP